MTMRSSGRERATDASELEVARVVGAHGIRGGLRVELHDADSRALRVDMLVVLRGAGGETRARPRVLRVAPKPGSHVVRIWLEGIEDRDAAESLRDCGVFVSRKDLPPLEEDEYYLADAIGSRVLERGRDLGTIVGVTTNNAQDLFEVEWTGPSGRPRRWLLPALPQFVAAIDDEGVHVELPPGLLPAELERGRAP